MSVKKEAQCFLPPRTAQTCGARAVMLDVLVALTPALAMSVFLFGPRVLVLTAVSVASCLFFEFLYRRLTGQASSLRDLSACVTGVLLAMCLPATVPYWAAILGAFFAIVLVKQFYGGLGRNFMNPALAGRMLLSTFPMMMTTWPQALHWPSVLNAADAVSGATPMASLHDGLLPQINFGQLLLGQHGGSLGEVSSLMLLLGGIYLILRRVISPRIPLSFLGTVAFLALVFTPAGVNPGSWVVYQLLSGGLLLGAFFMATDYATSPVTPNGQIYFGVGCGILTMLLRTFSSYPEGVGWAILTMNCCVWLLDRAGMPRRFGTEPLAAARAAAHRLLVSLRQIRLVRPQFSLLSSVRRKGTMPGEEHLDQIRAWGRQAAFLTVLVVVCAAGVLAVDRYTALDSARAAAQLERALLVQVMPQADMITETPYRAAGASSISAGYSDETGLVGYCVEVQPHGFGGAITMVVGVDLNGQVTGVAVTSHKETTGMGTQALEEDYLRTFIGRSGTIRTEGANGVDTVSGATATSEAVIAGVNRALMIVANLDTEGEVNYVDGEV